MCSGDDNFDKGPWYRDTPITYVLNSNMKALGKEFGRILFSFSSREQEFSSGQYQFYRGNTWLHIRGLGEEQNGRESNHLVQVQELQSTLLRFQRLSHS